MDLPPQNTFKEVLNKYGIHPSKGLGQNFLVDKTALKKVIEAAQIKPTDTILEIGPGMGNLTQELVKRAKKVIAVEKDGKMVEIMKETLGSLNNIEVIHEDALKLKIQIQKPYRIVANLPFYITAPVIRKFLESETPPEEMILVVQKEVAQRICAKVPDMNLLAVSVQFYASPKILGYISKGSFWPSPKVDSTIIKISRINANLPRINADLFFKIVKAGFTQPRKQLLNNLSKGLKMEKEKTTSWLSENNIQPAQRAETLNIEDWIRLAKSIPRS